MNVGTTIVEGVASGASLFTDPSKRNPGLLGMFVRGPGFVPTSVNSLEDFNTIFGGQSASYYGAAIVKNMFDEAQGAPITAYIARVVNDSFKVATGYAMLDKGETTESDMNVYAAYRGVEDPGEWANGVTVKLYSYGSLVKDMFTLTVSHDGSEETYSADTLAEIQSAVNRVGKYAAVEFTKEINKLSFTNIAGTVTASTSSRTVVGIGTTFLSNVTVGSVLYTSAGLIIGTVSSIESNTSLTLINRSLRNLNTAAIKRRNDTIYEVTLTGGVTGDITESDFAPVASIESPKGLACFDGYDVQMLACTEFHSLSMAKILDAYVSEKQTAIGIVNLPLNSDEGTAELYALDLQKAQKSFLCGYMGWIRVLDTEGNSMIIPSIGAVLGAGFIRTPYTQGDFIHIPPAGLDSLFSTVLEVIPARITQASVNRIVQQFTVNVIRHIENVGYYIGSSRLFTRHSMYTSIHIRLQTSYYTRKLVQDLKFMEQKPNTPELKNQANVALTTFGQTEYNNGALERSITFAEAWKIICDRSNNPVTQDRKLINIDILWIPTETTEAIRISLQRNDGILSTITE